MHRAFRTRLILAHVGIAIVLVACAATAIVALRHAAKQTEVARSIDARLELIETLRADTREIAMSARRHVLSGDTKEHQRVLSITEDIATKRAQLQVIDLGAQARVLEGQIETYLAAVIFGMTVDEGADTVARLARFEEDLVRVRAPLVATFDDIVERERTRRDASMTARSLARGARWAVLSAMVLGIGLVIGTVVSVVRRLEPMLPRAVAFPAPRPAGARTPVDAVALVDTVVRAHREAAFAKGIRVRYEAQLSASVMADRDQVIDMLDTMMHLAIASTRAPSDLVLQVDHCDAGTQVAFLEMRPDLAPRELHVLTLPSEPSLLG